MEFPTVCSRCGLSLAADNGPPLSTTPPDITDELTLVQGKLRQLEDTIHSLNTQRITLLRKLNELRSTPRKLPSEILSTIFHHASPPDPLNNLTFTQASQMEEFDGSYFPLILSAVSSRWREVAQSTPQLWTNIVVEMHSSSRGPQTAALLQQYFLFSKTLPISLGIIVQKCNRETDRGKQQNDQVAGLHSYLNPVAQTIFFGCPSRVKRLYLGDPPQGWSPFIKFDGFVHLEDLHLVFTQNYWSWGLAPGEPVTFAKIPSLHRLSLRNANVNLQTLGSTLTTLHMRSLFSEDAIKHLLSCPHIEEFHFRDPLDGWGEGEIPVRVLALSNLRVLGWPLTAIVRRHAQLFTNLDLPALEKLCIYVDSSFGIEDNILTTFIRFLSRISSTLSTLELVDLGGSDPFLPWVLNEIHPRRLNIIVGKNSGFVPYVIHELTPSPSEPRAKYLPGLRELCIKDANVSSATVNRKYPDLHAFEGNLVCGLVEMIRKRWEGNCAPLCLELSNICVDWTTEAKQELGAMVRAGLELEIISDLRPVEWLNATPQGK